MDLSSGTDSPSYYSISRFSIIFLSPSDTHVYRLEERNGVGGIFWQSLVDIPVFNDTASIQAE